MSPTQNWSKRGHFSWVSKLTQTYDKYLPARFAAALGFEYFMLFKTLAHFRQEGLEIRPLENFTDKPPARSQDIFGHIKGGLAKTHAACGRHPRACCR